MIVGMKYFELAMTLGVTSYLRFFKQQRSGNQEFSIGECCFMFSRTVITEYVRITFTFVAGEHRLALFLLFHPV